MGNAIDSFASGFAKAVGDLFNAPLDFLSGKSCSSTCGSTWDIICYIEHFCIANLLKLGLIILVFYIVLFFFYLTFKLGIFHCICHTLCKTIWACFAMCFYCWDRFHFLCHKLLRPRRRRGRRRWRHNEHIRDIEDFGYSSEDNDRDDKERDQESSCHSSSASEINVSRRMPSRRWREQRRSHLRRSLRPRSHKVQVDISHPSKRHHGKHRNRNHSTGKMQNRVRVTHTSKFAQKGKNCNRTAVYRSTRRYYSKQL